MIDTIAADKTLDICGDARTTAGEGDSAELNPVRRQVDHPSTQPYRISLPPVVAEALLAEYPVERPPDQQVVPEVPAARRHVEESFAADRIPEDSIRSMVRYRDPEKDPVADRTCFPPEETTAYNAANLQSWDSGTPKAVRKKAIQRKNDTSRSVVLLCCSWMSFGTLSSGN